MASWSAGSRHRRAAILLGGTITAALVGAFLFGAWHILFGGFVKGNWRAGGFGLAPSSAWRRQWRHGVGCTAAAAPRADRRPLRSRPRWPGRLNGRRRGRRPQGPAVARTGDLAVVAADGQNG